MSSQATNSFESLRVSAPSLSGTVVIWIGVLVAWIISPNAVGASGVAQSAAQLLLCFLMLALFIEFLRGPKNLLRLDVLMLVALYGLTMLEFLFEQQRINRLLTKDVMVSTVNVVLLGFASLAIARHVRFSRKSRRLIDISPKTVFFVLLVCFALGISYMLLSVNMNPIRLLSEMTAPRFSQSWTRARLGGLGDLLHEVQLLLYLVPAIAGLIEARRQNYSKSQIWISRIFLAITLFYGLTSGTRNIIFVFAITYVVAYLLSSRSLSRVKFIRMTSAALFVLLLISQVALDFRRIGFQQYVESILEADSTVQTNVRDELFLDYNLLTLGRVVERFSRTGEYLGWEVPVWALVKPIPRVLWRGKPEGLSIAIEDVRSERGAEAATWATTYLGEAYMAAGRIGVVIASLFFGVWAAWWNTRAAGGNDEYSILMYAAGVFAALISMRSMFWFTTALLPLVALYVLFRFLSKRRGRSRVGRLQES